MSDPDPKETLREFCEYLAIAMKRLANSQSESWNTNVTLRDLLSVQPVADR